MTARSLIERLLEPGCHCPTNVVDRYLERALQTQVSLDEASVHLPRRGKIWVARYTGPEPGQTAWRSTRLTDYGAALARAQEWERQAKAQRTSLGRAARKPTVRVRRTASGTRMAPFTQKEVALLLNMSERGVREVERRAFQKIRNHPLMRQAWQQYLSGELEEQQVLLTPEEMEALVNAARTPQECRLIGKVLRLVQR